MGKQEELEKASELIRSAQKAVEEQDLPQAVSKFTESIEHCRKVGLTGVELQAHGGLARTYQLMGDLANAAREYEVVRSLGELAGDKGSPYLAYSNLGTIYMHLGRFDDALFAARKTGDYARAMADKKTEVASRGLVGQILRRQGDLDGALSEALDGLALAQELGDVSEELAFLGDMTVISMLREEWEEASRIAKGALEKSQALGNGEARTVFLGHLSQISRNSGDTEGAKKFAQQGYESSMLSGNVREQAAFLQDLAVLDEADGEMERAATRYRESLDLLEELGHREGLVFGYRRLGLLLCKAGQHERGLAAVAHALMLSAPVSEDALKGTFSEVFPVAAQSWLVAAYEPMEVGLRHVKQALDLLLESGADAELLQSMKKAIQVLRALADSKGDIHSAPAMAASEMALEVDEELGTDLSGFVKKAYA